MSGKQGAFEKVVETLFFTLLYTSNPERDFFYAPLDGTEESFFGDSVAITEKVFVFEFKRSLGDVTGELKKYGKGTEGEFAGWVSQHTDVGALKHLSRKGHAFVALAQESKGGLGPLRSSRIAEFIGSAPYFGRLCDQSLQHSSEATQAFARLDPKRGLSLMEASLYFTELSRLRSLTGTGGKEGDTNQIVGFFVSNTNAISIVTANSYLNLLELIQRAELLNHSNDPKPADDPQSSVFKP